VSPRADRARWPLRLLLILGGILLGLTGAELFVRAFVPLQDVGPPLTEYDPVLGQRLKRSFRGVRETPEFRMEFSSNSLGQRGPELAGAKAEILFLGDSFTMGYGVDDGQEFPQLLGAKLGVPVANMGLGGTGPDRWPRILRGEARSFAPRIVVLQLCHTDVKDVARGNLASLDERGELVERDPPPLPAGRRLQKVLEVFPWIGESHLLGLLRQVRGRRARPASPGVEFAGDPPLARALLAESIRCCSEQDWKVVVLSADIPDSEAAPFAATCAEQGIPFLRMPSKREAPELYFAVDGHWTAAGHRRAAELLEPWLR
jgi:hypothetical protein